MADAARVNTFYSKAKVKLPEVTFEQSSTTPIQFKCAVALPAVIRDGSGFIETTFRACAGSKKAAKAEAMQAAKAFLAQQPVFQELMTGSDINVRTALQSVHP